MLLGNLELNIPEESCLTMTLVMFFVRPCTFLSAEASSPFIQHVR